MNKKKATTKEGAIREFILDKSEEVFRQFGFEKASMDAIAEQCGISKPTLYTYFQSKQTLFYDIHIRIQDHMYSKIKDILQQNQNPYSTLNHMLEEIFAIMVAKKEIMHLIFTEVSQMQSDQLQTHYAWHDENQKEIMAQLVGIIEPIIRPEIKKKFGAAVLVNHLANQLIGIMLMMTFSGETTLFATEKELILHQWQYGLLQPQPT